MSGYVLTGSVERVYNMCMCEKLAFFAASQCFGGQIF